MGTLEIPVLIVGGGGAGLTASNLLADLGVESLLVERHPGTSHVPKAHYLNQRTMEIFRQHGLSQPVYAKGTPRANLGKIIWQTSLGGDGPMDGVIFHRADAMGGGGVAAQYDLKGVTPPTNLPQLRLEPLLRSAAEARNPGRVRFRHELLSFSQDAEGVDALVLNLETKQEIKIRSRFMIAADAGKTIGPALGAKMIGASRMADFVLVHFSADLSQYVNDDLAAMRVIVHPLQHPGEKNAMGGLLALGPDHWDRHCEEWAVGWNYGPDDPDRHDETSIVPRLKAFLKVDVPITVHNVSHWFLEAVVSDTFRAERILIVGDAAHRHTPNTGLGLNSGIQDVHNLCWKLALVLAGKAPPALLASYESERRPVVQRNAEWSLFCLSNHATLAAALGLSMGAPAEVNEMAFRQLLADTPDGESRRARLTEVCKTQRIEYAAHDMEMGFQYREGAIVDDGSAWPARDPMGAVYTPSTRPGCRLAHAWLQRQGQAVSTHDLMPLGGFLLLTGPAGQAWTTAAQKIAAQTGLTLRAFAIGGGGDEPSDPSGAWAAVRGIADDGALLVRPDGHVAYRSHGAVADAHASLKAALNTVLAGGPQADA